jgi:hypothetical protein
LLQPAKFIIIIIIIIKNCILHCDAIKRLSIESTNL